MPSRHVHATPPALGWALAAVLLLCAQGAAAAAINLITVQERISTTVTFAVAGGNDTGPTDGLTLVGNEPTWQQAHQALALDMNDLANTIAVGFSSAAQATFLSAQQLASDGNGNTGASVFGSGVGRGEMVSELKLSFQVDVDTGFTLSASVNCRSTSLSCLSFVTLADPLMQPMLDLRSTSGAQQNTFTGTFLADQVYWLMASTTAVSGRNAPGEEAGGGQYSMQLMLANQPGGMVPEPPMALLLGLGLPGLLWWRRRVARRG
jgi:hypothetical protein